MIHLLITAINFGGSLLKEKQNSQQYLAEEMFCNTVLMSKPTTIVNYRQVNRFALSCFTKLCEAFIRILKYVTK